MSHEITTTEDPQIARESAAFEMLQRQAKMFASATLVPKEFQGNIANCAIGLNIAKRLGADPFMVLQNIDIIHGRPSFRATFLIAMVNAAGRFEPLQFKMDGTDGKPDRSCIAWTKSKADGATLEGPKITLEMAKAEGWSTKNGSKWLTMPELMLRYRAAAFFARLYAPDITLGMMTAEEAIDTAERDVTPPNASESRLFKTHKEALEYIRAEQSPAKSATAGSPPSLRDGQKEAQQNEPAEFSLSDEPLPLSDQVFDKLHAAGLKWSEIYTVMADQGLADPEFVPLNEAPADVLASCLAQFDAIVNIVKGVKP
jgi:hypothetical protein